MDDTNLNDETPELSGIGKKDIYRVPDGFFDEMEGGIFEKVATGQTAKYVKMKSWLELAATIAIVITATLTANKFLPFEVDMTDNTVNAAYDVPSTNAVNFYPIF